MTHTSELADINTFKDVKGEIDKNDKKKVRNLSREVKTIKKELKIVILKSYLMTTC